MQSKYVEAEAARLVEARDPQVSELLALRTYTARLLGSTSSLVLYGGGNTSVKARVETAFGESVDVLHIKGSGWDLATIEPAGHPAARLSTLRRLLEQPAMTDEQMVNEMRLALLDATAPTPSVEALLHAALPARFIDHTHADAILALCDQADGEAICRRVYGAGLLWIPYVMPGFGLAKACKAAWDRAASGPTQPSVMVLERHGIFTFGDTARQSYERMIEAVTAAEHHAQACPPRRTPAADRPVTEGAANLEFLSQLRGALASAAGEAPECGSMFTVRTNEAILAFLDRPDMSDIVARGCVTPDHVLRIKPFPLVVAPPVGSGTDLRATLERAVATYAHDYNAYFSDTSKRRGVSPKKLDPWPRVVLVPGLGIVALGKTKKDADTAADIYEHTIYVMNDAERVGSFSPVSRDDLFDAETWSLEQAKIKKTTELPLSRRIALVTGAASGIGRATAEKFASLGAHVVACDQAEWASSDPRITTMVCDVTKPAHVERLVDHAVRTYGGVDIVVSNAGSASQGRLDTPEGAAALRTSTELNLFSHNAVAAAAVRVMLQQGRGGCLLFNASKSAFNQGPGFGPYAVAKAALVALMRQYAVDLGAHQIRSNAVNADRVRTAIFPPNVVESRAAARGLSTDEYFRSNLLVREVEAGDVADAFAYLAQARSTTGCTLTVDGGNAAAFPR